MILGIEKNKEEMINDILTITGLHISKLRNIYVYGSRVYGTYTLNSDIDIIVIACSMYLNQEFHEGIYNIHVTTPDAFKEQLDNHDIHCLECIYAPHEAQLMTQIDYLKDFKLDISQLKKMLISQSTWAWQKAQRRIEKGDIIGGGKSLFHSLRIINFGLQIIHNGKIANFTKANHIWQDVKAFKGLEWAPYQDRWMGTKKQDTYLFKRAGKEPELIGKNT